MRVLYRREPRLRVAGYGRPHRIVPAMLEVADAHPRERFIVNRRRPSWRRIRNRGLWRLLLAGQSVGLDILPHHFYSNVPDIRALRNSDHWRGPRTLTGVRGADLAEQEEWLTALVSGEIRDALAAREVHRLACAENGAVGYGRIEADLLFAFVAAQRPGRVVQVGSGVSSSVVLQAKRAFGLATELVCIDPFPTEFLCAAANRGEIELLAEPAQTVPLELFTSLAVGDLLFVDSTHTVKPGSEVNRLVLEILPQLAPGVFVHFHDICFPYDHLPDVLNGELFFWNETVLLHAYLVGNDRMTLRLSASMLHHGRPAALRAAFPRYEPLPMTDGMVHGPQEPGDFPSSAYLQVL